MKVGHANIFIRCFKYRSQESESYLFCGYKRSLRNNIIWTITLTTEKEWSMLNVHVIIQQQTWESTIHIITCKIKIFSSFSSLNAAHVNDVNFRRPGGFEQIYKYKTEETTQNIQLLKFFRHELQLNDVKRNDIYFHKSFLHFIITCHVDVGIPRTV